MDYARAVSLWITGRERAELREQPLPAPGADEVLVRTLYSGISRGTESLVYRGRVPQSQYQTMRAPFQEGEFPAPVKYGYSNVGRVERGPAALSGQKVFCLFPHQSAYVVPAEAVVPLPEALPPQRAVLGANMETAVNALWDAAPQLGDRIAIIGAGVIGCLFAALAARLPGIRVELVDVNANKAGIADTFGVAFRAPEAATEDADLVIHASGTAAGLRYALALAGYEATVVEMSWFGDEMVALPLGEAFHSQRLTLRASQVGGIAPARRPRWNHRRRLALALELLTDPVFDALITGEDDFDTLPVTLAQLVHSPGTNLCHRIRYP